MSDQLSNSQLRALDEWLFNWQHIDRKIAIRKLELQTDTNTEVDENIGGGKANHVSRVTETVIARWDADQNLKGLENFKRAVLETLEVLDTELTAIFYLRWGTGSINTWEEIGAKHHLSRKSIYRKRERILEIFSQKIGM
ncbi:transcriptional regulator [Streptococcus pluranimalium]